MSTSHTPAAAPGRYGWARSGDVNAFFGLMLDNVAVLIILFSIISSTNPVRDNRFSAEFVLTHMIPGTAVGVLLGDLIYTWMAFRLAKRTGNRTVTAMPLGLDTPSTIGLALTVLGPAFIALKAQGMAPPDAAMMTWYIGMATMVFIGLVKLILSFVGPWVQRVVPQAGLLGSLAGVGLALLGYLPMVEVLGLPLIGIDRYEPRKKAAPSWRSRSSVLHHLEISAACGPKRKPI